MSYPPSSTESTPKTPGIAITSLVLAIVSFICFLGPIAAIPAVICGHIAVNRIKKSQGALGGSGLGLAGLIVGYINIASSLIMIPLFMAIAIPNFVKARSQAQTNACVNNLRQLDGARDQWAIEMKKREGEPVNASDLDPYLKNGTAGLKCPAGGSYTFSPLGEVPTCSVEEHALPE